MRFTNLALLSALSVSLCPALQTSFQWQGGIGPGRFLEIKGINGFIHAEPAAGGVADVSAVKHAKRSDPNSVEVKVVETAQGVTICAVYPNSNGRANECGQGSGGHMETRDNDVQVDFTVRVPAGIRFLPRTVNGEIEINNLAADVEAHTVNGGVKVSTSGVAQAKTVNGSIEARLGNPAWTKPVEFNTVNGSINVDLPASVSSEVRADTVNGNINTDFPLTVTGKIVGRHLQGTIGAGGGRTLTLKTVNGSIRLRRI